MAETSEVAGRPAVGVGEGKEQEEEVHIPFEWLTNFASLSHYLDPDSLFPSSIHQEDNQEIEEGGMEKTIRKNQKDLNVLHVGCGSSKLGEMLQRRFPRYNYVLNVDNDVEILLGMKRRWGLRLQKWKQFAENENSNLGDGDISPTPPKDRVRVRRQSPSPPQLKYAFMDFQRRNDCGDDDQLSDDDSSWKHPDLDQFQTDQDPSTTPKFDLVLDKSTLDCLLCSDGGAAGLLCKVYKHLKANGIYFLVSFHHVDFIQPILEECPGVNWTIHRYIVPREVDSPAVVKRYEAMVDKDGLLPTISKEHNGDQCELGGNLAPGEDLERSSNDQQQPSAWKSGEFCPDEEYGRTVNVFICQRKGNTDDGDDVDLDQILDYEKVMNHIHVCNDNYFKTHNPMVTHVRKEELKHKFNCELQNIQKERNTSMPVSSILPLRSCYEILFTEAEKEHLAFDYFMEDWVVYCKEQNEDGEMQMVEDGMTFNIAIDFLQTMQ